MDGTIINWNDFEKIDIRVGTILKSSVFEESKNPSFKLSIDFGKEIGIKKSSAQITKDYSCIDLIGKQIIAIVNLPKKQIANIQSECLVLGIMNGLSVILLQPDIQVENGLRIG